MWLRLSVAHRTKGLEQKENKSRDKKCHISKDKNDKICHLKNKNCHNGGNCVVTRFTVKGSSEMTIHKVEQRGLFKRLKSSSLVVGVAAAVIASSVFATPEDQAKRIHDRLTGNLPSPAVLADMATLTDAGDLYGAARVAIDNPVDHSFYNVTLKNWASPWTNRDFDAFADLNDYTATVIGYVRDSDTSPVSSDDDPSLTQEGLVDFRGVLYDDALYLGPVGLSNGYAVNNNDHYIELESGIDLDGDPGYSLKTDLRRVLQSVQVPALSGDGASGVITSRAGAKAFLIAGTNRAAFRFTMLNHLCLDMENVHDVTRVPDRVRQDVSRSPGGDSSIFLNSCVGCHSGMDPLTQSLAYHNYAVEDRDADPTGETGVVEYTDGTVQPKYFNNDATFPPGFVTPDNSWVNYWREGQNTFIGWDDALPGSGVGASSMFQELAHSHAFAQCHINRVFKTVCLRDPTASDLAGTESAVGVNEMIDNFMSGARAGDMKHVFASSAVLCAGE